MADRFQQRRDTAARWAQFNPVLLEGEVGYVTDDPNQYKIGDGVHTWNELPLRGFDGTLVHTTGDSTTSVMSQKTVSDEFAKLRTAGYIYAGIATATTNPGTPVEKVFYVATTAGTYTNFGNKAVNNGITILSWNSTSWTSNELISIKSEVGSNENAVMSQKIVSNLLRGEAASISDNIRSPYTFIGNFATWTEVQTELDKLHNSDGGADNKVIGEFRVLLDGRNLLVRSWVQSWATGVFTQTVEGSIRWNGETMEQSLQIATYERRYNEGSGWGEWKSVETSGGNMILDWKTNAATTRKQVPQDERKAGMMISYRNASGEWINEQYVGMSFDDTSWAADANWQQIGASAIELAQELSTEEGSEDKAISQKAVSEKLLYEESVFYGKGDMTGGMLSRTDGTVSDSSAYLVSNDYIPIPERTEKIIFKVQNASGAPCICFYNNEKQFITYKIGSAEGTSVSFGEARFFKCSFSSVGNTSSGVTVLFRKMLPEKITDIECDIEECNGQINTVNADLQNYKDELLISESYNTLVIRSGGEKGKVNTSDGTINADDTPNGYLSKEYDISKVVRIVIHNNDSSAPRQSYLFLYDAGRNLVANYSRKHTSSDDIDVVPPEDAVYMRWGYWQHNGDFILYKRNIDDYAGKSKDIKKQVLDYGGYKIYQQYVYPTIKQWSLQFNPNEGTVTAPESQPGSIGTTALDCTSYIDIRDVERVDAFLSLKSSSIGFAFFDEDKDTIISYASKDGVPIEDEDGAYKFENVPIPWNARYIAFNANRSAKNKYIVLYKRALQPQKNIGGPSTVFFNYNVDGAFDDFEDSEKSTSEQNVAENGTDEGMLLLPRTYSYDGEPTRLIIYSRGATDKALTPQSTSIDLTDGGFAVLTVTGTPSIRRNEQFCPVGVNMGNWQYIRCICSAYRYVCEKFNIDTGGVFLCGTSLGGLCALNTALSGCLPVRAMALDAPVIDLYHDAYFNGGWLDSTSQGSTPVMVAWCYNWDGINWDDGTYTINEQTKSLSELKDNGADMTALWELNANKMIGFNAYKTADFPIKNVDEGGHHYDTTGENEDAVLTDNDDEYYGKKMPCPIKIWFASIDSINQIEIAKRFLKKCRNGGSIAVFRTVTSAIHGVIGYDYVKKEIMNWFNRWR